jgi:hypothetical protein
VRKKKVYSSVRLILPRGIKVKELKLSNEQLYFLNLLTRDVLRINSPKQKVDFLRYRMDFLVRQVSSNARKLVIEPLLQLGWIEIQPNAKGSEMYSKGRLTKGYRLSPNLLSAVLTDKLKLYRIDGTTTLARRLFKLRLERKESALASKAFLKREYDWMVQLRFDRDKATNLHEEFMSKGRRPKGKYTKGTMMRVESDFEILSNLSSGDFEFNEKGGRVYSAIATAVSDFRCCLMDPNGNHYLEIDIKTSQFLFLLKALYLRKVHQVQQNLTDSLIGFIDCDVDLKDEVFGTNTDLRQLYNVVVFDDIYQWFSDRSSFNDAEKADPKSNITRINSTTQTASRILKEERSESKMELLQDVLYNYHTRKKDTPMSRAFRANFPNVLSFLEQCAIESERVKKSSETSLLLQSYEAFFVHQFALDRLEQAFPDRLFYTVHDSFGVPEDIVDECFDIIAKAVEDHFGLKDGSVVLKFD